CPVSGKNRLAGSGRVGAGRGATGSLAPGVVGWGLGVCTVCTGRERIIGGTALAFALSIPVLRRPGAINMTTSKARSSARQINLRATATKPACAGCLGIHIALNSGSLRREAL